MRGNVSIEELANSVTHGIGLVLSLVGLAGLVVLASTHGTAWHIVGCTVFGVSLVVLYTSSTLYHSFSSTRARRALQVADHCAIYLLIAGTYTPFTLTNLRGAWGWSLLAIVWALTIAGIVFKFFFVERFKLVSILLYVMMGWMGVVAIRPILAAVPVSAMVWLFLGGLAYTVGLFFFGSKRLRFGHAVWHVFVLFGSICHFIAVATCVVAGN